MSAHGPHGHDHQAHDHGHGHAHHGGHHGHSHSVPTQFDRAFALGISANLLFVAVELFYGWKVNSLALLADAAHNLGDVAGLALAWAGAWASRRSPSARYTYGWKRASVLAALTNAVLLLVAMGSLMWEALVRLQAPLSGSTAHGATVMAVAALGIAVNLGTAMLFMRGQHTDLNLRGAYLHMLADAAVSASVVVVGALVWWLGWRWLDAATSVAIALLIVLSTWRLLRQSLHLMLDGVPEHIHLDAVRQLLARQTGVQRVMDLHVWATSTADVALTAHLVMPDGHPGDAFLQTLTQQLRDEFNINHVTLQTVRQPFTVLCDGA
jgi:cobalt-zinc-cadmium efflux system protein